MSYYSTRILSRTTLPEIPPARPQPRYKSARNSVVYCIFSFALHLFSTAPPSYGDRPTLSRQYSVGSGATRWSRAASDQGDRGRGSNPLALSSYAMSGTDLGQRPTRCPVLTKAMLLCDMRLWDVRACATGRPVCSTGAGYAAMERAVLRDGTSHTDLAYAATRRAVAVSTALPSSLLTCAMRLRQARDAWEARAVWEALEGRHVGALHPALRNIVSAGAGGGGSGGGGGKM
eukprot:83726-Rhodomonas_salina.1